MGRAIVNKSTLPCKGAGVRSKSLTHSYSTPHDAGNTTGRYQIRAVTKALDLLDAICESADGVVAGGEEVRIAQLSRQLGLQKAAVFRLLATFQSRGYLEHDAEAGSYRIGMNAYEMGCKLLLRMPLLREARPVLEDLCRRCNEAVYLAVRNNNDFLFIDLIEGAQQVKVASLLGKRYPLPTGAPGRLMQALSLPSVIAIDGALKTVREQGFCIDRNEIGDQVTTLAVPLFNAAREIVGAACLVGPSFRLSQEEIDHHLLPHLIDAGATISAKLGHLR